MRVYWEKALERVSDLRFELLDMLVSVNSLVFATKRFLGSMLQRFLLWRRTEHCH